MSETPLEELLLRWEDGDLEQAEIEQLRVRLKTDSVQREAFVRFQFLSLALQNQADESLDGLLGEQLSAEPNTVKRGGESAFSLPTWLLVLAASLLLAVMIRWAYVELQHAERNPRQVANEPATERTEDSNSQESTTGGLSTEARARGVAIVTQFIPDKGENQPEAPVAGQAISPGRFELADGLAQIEFFCGASVVLEGPADLEIVSSTEAIFHRGKLRAVVPPAARGFTIRTADLRVVDLGTEFGIEVSPAGANVEVFDGEVEIHSKGTTEKLLAGTAFTEGQALPGEARAEAFSSVATVQQLLKSQKRTTLCSLEIRTGELVETFVFDRRIYLRRT